MLPDKKYKNKAESDAAKAALFEIVATALSMGGLYNVFLHEKPSHNSTIKLGISYYKIELPESLFEDENERKILKGLTHEQKQKLVPTKYFNPRICQYIKNNALGQYHANDKLIRDIYSESLIKKQMEEEKLIPKVDKPSNADSFKDIW